MVIDIVDKELNMLRNAFADDFRESTNRKATIVNEHLILASDIAQTM